MAQRKLPIFQLKADCDPAEFTQVQLTQTYADGRTIRRETPTMDGVSIEAVLYCIHKFQEVTVALDFTAGDELFTYFRRILHGAAKDDWDSVIATILNRTPLTFARALNNWKSEMILPTARQSQVDYLETLTKPHQMTVESFVNGLTAGSLIYRMLTFLLIPYQRGKVESKMLDHLKSTQSKTFCFLLTIQKCLNAF
jgi:hypothetical protein